MENVRNLLFVLFGGLIAGVFGGFVGIKVFDSNEFNDSPYRIVEEHVYIEDSKIIEAIGKVDPAVVSVISSSDIDPKSLEAANPEDVYGGTGFIVDAAGLIFTNKHVVADDDAEYKIVLNDGREFLVEILSVDPFDDVAVLKIQSDEDLNLPVVNFGDSDQLKIGQRVVAIGNALAVYGNTVTAGIVSAIGRDVVAYNDFGGTLQNLSGLIQTDAAINLGNSGGPLINLDGQVIGMNAALAESADNIGFAIPVNDLKPVINSVKKYGEIIRPVLGVNFLMLNKNQAKDFDAALDHGAILIDGGVSGRSAVAPGGAAAKAGLREADIILSVDSKEVVFENPLQKIIRNYNPGDEIKLKVWRDGQIIDVNVVLKSNKDL